MQRLGSLLKECEKKWQRIRKISRKQPAYPKPRRALLVARIVHKRWALSRLTRCRRQWWFASNDSCDIASTDVMCGALRSSWPTMSWERRLAIRCELSRRDRFRRESAGV